MTYVMSDLHGCYDSYREMLCKIRFKASDILYVLGDVLDRGKNPIKILQDMSTRANVIPIMGNHEYIAIDILRKLLVEITDRNAIHHIDDAFWQDLELWQSIGGQTTMRELFELPRQEREYMVEYIEDFSLYEIATVGNTEYILTHAGIPQGATRANLGSYDAYDFATAEIDYSRQYFDDAYLVSGHIPTAYIGEQYRGKAYRENNHIAIDTGGVFGVCFCCVCLDTGAEYYTK